MSSVQVFLYLVLVICFVNLLTLAIELLSSLQHWYIRNQFHPTPPDHQPIDIALFEMFIATSESSVFYMFATLPV